VRLAAGFALLIAGSVLAIPGIPGPGVPIIVAGLVLLSDRFVWAGRSLAWLRTIGQLGGRRNVNKASGPKPVPRLMTKNAGHEN
jgi:hypothetical protein